MKKILLLPSLIILLALLAIPLATKALANKNDYSTAIIIGEHLITHLDIKQRLHIALITSGLEPTESNKRLLLPQIVQILIDETLYKQKATALNITISEYDIQKAIASIEQKNNLPPNSFNAFLKANQLSEHSFKEQLKAQIAWKKIISRKIKPLISVSNEEVTEELEQVTANTNQEEVFLSEISLPIENNSEQPKIQALANKLSTQLQRGSSFNNIAKQFSRSASSDNNGEIGWVATHQLARPLRNAVLTLKINSISAPIRTQAGYTIIKLHKRRIIDRSNNHDYTNSLVTIKQLFIPITKYTAPNRSNTLKQDLQKTAHEHTVTCQTIDNIATQKTDIKETKEIATQTRKLHPEIRKVVEELAVNTPSNIIQTSLGLHIFIVCDRQFPETTFSPPSRQIIKEKLIQKKLILNTRKYLRNLRRQTFIEIRL